MRHKDPWESLHSTLKHHSDPDFTCSQLRGDYKGSRVISRGMFVDASPGFKKFLNYYTGKKIQVLERVHNV